MFCRKCGSELLQNALFCSHCGTKVIMAENAEEVVFPDSASEAPTYETLNLQVQTTISAPTQPIPEAEHTPITEPSNLSRYEMHKYQLAIARQSHGMNWYEFLLYCPLIISPVLSIIYGLNMILGLQYDGKADQVYATFYEMQMLDVLGGLLLFGAAAFTIYTRYRLYEFSERAPTLIMFVYIVNSGVGALYFLACYIILASYGEEDYSLITELLSTVITNTFFVIANYIYFKKRRHYFTY